MSSYNEFKKELLKNPEVKAEYDALEPEFNIIQAMIDARKQQNLTQEELSKRTGITQADISRIENGTRNPSLEMVFLPFPVHPQGCRHKYSNFPSRGIQ